ncbi:MAG: hypothetical protein EAZ76_04580 [Nostocales cyanobacterium]|nr:MAG: hypothetical protein EAZ76_04580 [Nostocales cyanobacterium]
MGSLYLCSEIINIPPYTTVHNCKKLNAVIPDETWQALEEIAKKEQRTKSQMAAILLGEALMLKMDRNYEAQQSQLQEFQRQTQEFQRQNHRVLDYLLRQSGQN